MEKDREMQEIQARDRVRQIIAAKTEKLIDAILANHWNEPTRLASALADLSSTAIALTFEYRHSWHLPADR